MSSPSSELIQMKLAKLARLEQQMEERRKFPHRHMHKFYPWSRDFFENWTDKVQVLCAANQCSKSSSMMKKAIEMATSPHLWPAVWPGLPAGQKPGQWWWLYPTKDVATTEFHEKWKMFLPQVDDDDPRYGWKESRGSHGIISRVSFNSGVNIYFKAYKQDVQALQSGSCYAVFCFIAGTKIKTPTGERNIETLSIGDSVVTRDGPRKVERFFERDAEVCTITMTNGRTLTGTLDHPIWTGNRGWVELSCLTQDDLLLQPGCLSRKLLSSIKKCIHGSLTTLTREYVIITSRHAERVFTSPFGLRLMDLCLRAGSSITKTLTHLITIPTTLKACLELTTRSYIRSLNGLRLNSGPLSVLSAYQFSSLDHLKRDLPNTVQNLAGGSVIEKLSRPSVGLATSLSSEGQTAQPTVLTSVQIKNIKSRIAALSAKSAGSNSTQTDQSQYTALPGAGPQRFSRFTRSLVASVKSLLIALGKPHGFVQIVAPPCIEKKTDKVYCLKVADTPEYFANGILVHNCDEEVPTALLPELQMRTNATSGYQFYAFTATLGQPFWRKVVEERSVWPHARVWQIGLPDCEFYDDGTPSMWTPQRVQRTIESCASPNEVAKRVFGRFILDSGLLYPQFDSDAHISPFHLTPATWDNFAGIDYGTGGTTGHPATIVIIAVNPERTQVRVIRAWRGDKISTTAQDIVNKFMEMAMGLKVVTAYYDYGPGGRDVGTIANRLGLPFEPANKGAEEGRSIIQSLLKNRAIKIYDHVEACAFPSDHLEAPKLIEEFMGSTLTADKRNAKLDDLLDALRYSLSKIPWNWEAMMELSMVKEEQMVKAVLGVDDERASHTFRGPERTLDDATVDEEIEFWQEQFET